MFQLDLAVLNIKTSMHCGQEQPICPSLPPSLHSSFVSAVEDPSPSAGLYHLDPTELQSFAIQVANGMVSSCFFPMCFTCVYSF